MEPEMPCDSVFGELSRAVVERRREQAAEAVPIPLLWRGARQGGVVARQGEVVARQGEVVKPHLEPAERNPAWIQSELPQETPSEHKLAG